MKIIRVGEKKRSVGKQETNIHFFGLIIDPPETCSFILHFPILGMFIGLVKNKYHITCMPNKRPSPFLGSGQKY